jgi:hypothetical protein
MGDMAMKKDDLRKARPLGSIHEESDAAAVKTAMSTQRQESSPSNEKTRSKTTKPGAMAPKRKRRFVL